MRLHLGHDFVPLLRYWCRHPMSSRCPIDVALQPSLREPFLVCVPLNCQYQQMLRPDAHTEYRRSRHLEKRDPSWLPPNNGNLNYPGA